MTKHQAPSAQPSAKDLGIEIKSRLFGSEEHATSGLAHFHHKGGYYATFQYTDTNNRWWGWTSLTLGTTKSFPWWPGVRVRAYAEFFGIIEPPIYEGPIGVRQTLVVWGTIFEPVGGIYGPDEALALLRHGAGPVLANDDKAQECSIQDIAQR